MREGVGAVQGSVDEAVADDFPGLSVWSIECEILRKKKSRNVDVHLGDLDDRMRGIAIGGLRNDRIASCYRAFARQVGLDPDVERNALDEAALERLKHGRFKTKWPLDQALLVGMLETGVPLWSFDAKGVSGGLRIGVGEDESGLWVRDERHHLVPMLSPPPDELQPGKETKQAVVFALRVDGVPATTIEEAFWHVRSCLSEED